MSDAILALGDKFSILLAAIESMSCGLPVITSNIHGINDYSIDGVTGYKCAPDDVDGFKNAIEKLLADSSLREKMGAVNKEAVKKYNISSVLEEMRIIYDM